MIRSRPSAFGRVFTLLIYLFLYAPIFVLIVFSFNASNSRTVWSGFSLEWYEKLFEDSIIMSSLSTTLAVSVLSALLATVIGVAASIGFFSMKKRMRSSLMAVNSIPMMNADIVTGVSLCLLFVAAGAGLSALASWLNGILGTNFKWDITLGFGTLLIAHITFNVPYVILSIMPKLYQMDRHLIDAAKDLGCTTSQAIRKVVIPEIMPGIINGALMAFTMSIDDFVISYFTAGSTTQTLAMSIYSMTKKKVTPKVNAISTLLFLVVMLLLIVVNVRSARQEKKRPHKFPEGR